MMNNKAFRSIFACLIAMLLVMTMVPVAVFAEDAVETTVADAVADAATEDEHEGHDHADETTGETTGETEEEKSLGLGFWISMGVLGALVIVGVVFAIIKREKLNTWLLSYKSELKKIVWSSKNDVKKNTIVVVVAVIAIAIVVGLLDFAFNKGIVALGKLF